MYSSGCLIMHLFISNMACTSVTFVPVDMYDHLYTSARYWLTGFCIAYMQRDSTHTYNIKGAWERSKNCINPGIKKNHSL